MWKNLVEHEERISRWAMVVITFIGVGVVYSQLTAANEQNRWQHYNDLNARYAAFYGSIPNEVSSGKEANFDKLGLQSKRWIRQYFDLYSEEYWLYKNRLIPEEMWTKRIRSGVHVNLLEYPLLARGYLYWKERGAFRHPDGFSEEAEHAIAEASNRVIKSRPQVKLPPGKAGGLSGEPLKGADKTVSRLKAAGFFTPSPLQGEGWDGGRNFDCAHP